MTAIKEKKLYFPALSILGTVFILLILTTVSTYRSLKWQREHNMAFLEEKALTIFKVLEAGVRAGVRMRMWDERLIRALVEETGQEKSIAYLYLSTGDGRILHHSIRSIEGQISTWNPELTLDKPVAKRIHRPKDGSPILDLAKVFMPDFSKSTSKHDHWQRFHSHHGDIIVLGLHMDAYEAARKSDLRHALIMGGIVVALGSGALFFLLVIQNVYTLDRSLQKTRDLNRQIIVSMADGLIGLDPDGRMVVANPLARSLLHLGDGKLAGLDFNDFLSFDQTGIRETIETGRPVINREISFQEPQGDFIPISISATPISGQVEEIDGVVVLIRDLREIKRLEADVRRSEKLAAIGRLAAGVAHEVRNPLSSIRGFAGYLATVLKNQPKEQECAEIMVSEVDRINRVISDLLSLSHQRSPELSPVAVEELLDHVKNLVARDAEERGITILCNVDANTKELMLDRNQMTQVLLNLTINALKAVGDQNGKIELGCAQTADGSYLRIWVKDNGSGIALEEQERIFEPFYTGRDDGTGLGLAVVRNIIAAHEGSINVCSPPSDSLNGTCFEVRLPKQGKE